MRSQTEQIIELFQMYDIQKMNKLDIYTKIEHTLNVPRPTIRRAINMFLKRQKIETDVTKIIELLSNCKL